jgi:hypothetical protein
VAGLSDKVRRSTTAPNEALQLAFKNAGVVIDGGGSEGAHRTYGCLYGLDTSDDNVVPIVPSSVAFASGLQKALSAIFIFLFGLGLRNMLRLN